MRTSGRPTVPLPLAFVLPIALPIALAATLTVVLPLWPLALRAAESPAEEEGADALFGVGAELDARTRYVWHGLPMSAGPVLQSSVWGTIWRCTPGVFLNAPLPAAAPDARDVDLDEIDVGVDCSYEVGPVTVQVGLWAYLFPTTDVPTSGEALLRIELPWEWFRAYTAHAVDIGSAPGAYAGEVGVGAGWEWERFGVEARLGTGWATAKFNETNAGVAEFALNFVSASVVLPIDLGLGLYLQPRAGVFVLIPRSLVDAFGERVVVDSGLAFGGEWDL